MQRSAPESVTARPPGAAADDAEIITQAAAAASITAPTKRAHQNLRKTIGLSSTSMRRPHGVLFNVD
jgi:hypothetical protein